MISRKNMVRALSVILVIPFLHFLYKSCQTLILVSTVNVADYPSDFDVSVKASGLPGLDFNTLLEFKTGGELIKLDSRDAMLRVLKIPIPPPDTVLVSKLQMANTWDSGFDPFNFPDIKSRYKLVGNNIFTNDPTRVSLIFTGGNYRKYARDAHDYYAFKSIQSLSFDLNDKSLFSIGGSQSADIDVFLRNSTDSLYIGVVYHQRAALE